MKAKLIRTISGWHSDARLYSVDPPMAYQGMEGEDKPTTEFVIVSAVVAQYSGPETYIFPAKKGGTAINMLEMDGSLRGVLDHVAALRSAGYEVTP
jgi:hypothetical protein